ncbi:MAG: hypothetical protein WBG36_11975 [Ornithinimicrobium sp.]
MPRPSRATLLVPDRPRKATAAALKNYKSPSTRRGRLQARVLQVLGQTGAGVLSPSRATVRIVTGHDSLPAHFGRLLGEDFVIAMHLGPPRANQKPVVQIMRRNGDLVAFAKVGVNDLTRQRVAGEVAALTELSRRNLIHLSVPRVLHHGAWGDCVYVLLAPVPTWTAGRIDTPARIRAMRELAQTAPTSRGPLSGLPWWHRTKAALERVAGSAEADQLIAHGRWMQHQWGDLELEVGPAHGDWTPWNMATPGGQVVLWDWERFAGDVPVGFDALHYGLEAAVRLDGMSPREAVEDVTGRMGTIVAENGAKPEKALPIFALYLLGLGERFITDGQREAGASKGGLSLWLLPGLERLVERASRGNGEH